MTIVISIQLGLSRHFSRALKIVLITSVLGLNLLGLFYKWQLLGLFWHSHSVWTDIEVIATKSKNDRIVEQRIDSGALGYDKRIVREIKLTNFLSWKIDIKNKNLDTFRKEGWTIVSDRLLKIGG